MQEMGMVYGVLLKSLMFLKAVAYWEYTGHVTFLCKFCSIPSSSNNLVLLAGYHNALLVDIEWYLSSLICSVTMKYIMGNWYCCSFLCSALFFNVLLSMLMSAAGEPFLVCRDGFSSLDLFRLLFTQTNPHS
jgi:hypothetical protein